MKQFLLSALVLAAMSSTALAAEPLTEQQMDAVTAGQTLTGVTALGFFNLPGADPDTPTLSLVFSVNQVSFAE